MIPTRMCKTSCHFVLFFDRCAGVFGINSLLDGVFAPIKQDGTCDSDGVLPRTDYILLAFVFSFGITVFPKAIDQLFVAESTSCNDERGCEYELVDVEEEVDASGLL